MRHSRNEMIEVVCSQRSGKIVVSGHAGAGEFGNDLVCAAASILALAAKKAFGDEKVRLERGHAELELQSEDAVRVIMAGYEWLEDNCPQYVKVIRRR